MTNYDYVFNRHSGNLRPVQWIEVPITRAYYQPNRKIVTHQELANAIRFLSIDAIEKAKNEIIVTNCLSSTNTPFLDKQDSPS